MVRYIPTLDFVCNHIIVKISLWSSLFTLTKVCSINITQMYPSVDSGFFCVVR